ncbi:MAG: hypothetical protein SFY32_11980 [Bacteroidota bacterium]|nr:hypothetical protein [Bacteroidota bacterium]
MDINTDWTQLLPAEFQLVNVENQSEKSLLQSKILHLLRNDFNKLISVLYTIDIDEKKSKTAFLLKDDVRIANELTDLIINRLIQKIKFRNFYN